MIEQVLKFYNRKTIAAQLGITLASLSQKITGQRQWSDENLSNLERLLFNEKKQIRFRSAPKAQGIYRSNKTRLPFKDHRWNYVSNSKLLCVGDVAKASSKVETTKILRALISGYRVSEALGYLPQTYCRPNQYSYRKAS